MDFDFSDEEKRFRKDVEAFLVSHHSPEVMDPNPEQLSQTVETPPKRAFMRKLAERGWLGMSWPREYGGAERPGIYDFLLTDALSRVGAPQPGKGVGIVGKTIIRHGSEKLKRSFLPRIIRGEIEFAIGYSEPQAGSDAANMQLRATRDGDGWRLNGQKTWTIGDERTNEVFFDDVWVGDDFVVGEVNRGWTYICEALDLERFAMMPVGPLEEKIEALLEYVSKARRDGEPLRADPRVRQTVAQAVTRLEVARMLQRRVVSEALKGRVPTVESSMYKLFMTELGQRVSDAALEILGPAAQLKPGVEDAPLNGRFERSYRYTAVDTIGGGASEIQKNIIARRGLGLPRCY